MRKINLTSAGVAMKSTIKAWMTCTISNGVPVTDSKFKPLVWSAPNRKAAKTVPNTVALPNKATVIASKP